MIVSRKILVITMSVLILTGLSSCGKDKPAQPSSAQRTAASPTLTPMAPGDSTSGSTTRPPTGSEAKGGVPSPIQAPMPGETVSLVGVTFELPGGWIQETPATQMRLAQYRLPGEAGPAELAAFSFGVGQGGTTDANIQRWVAQFKNPQGGQPEADVSSFQRGSLKISIVKTSGTYTPTSMGPMAPASPPKPNQALFGIIVEGGPQGTLFIKVTGPKDTMDAQEQALLTFAHSARLAG